MDNFGISTLFFSYTNMISIRYWVHQFLFVLLKISGKLGTLRLIPFCENVCICRSGLLVGPFTSRNSIYNTYVQKKKLGY